MAEELTIARPYAKAAFELALASADLQAWADFLQVAARVLCHKEIIFILNSPQINTPQKVAVLVDITKSNLNPQRQHFLDLLGHNHRLALLPAIAQLFEYYKIKHAHSVEVELRTAFELGGSQKKRFAKALQIRLQCDVKLAFTLDESLLGGALVRAGDFVIDGSVKGKLERLRQRLVA